MTEIFVSKSPDDPNEKQIWVNDMRRIVVSMYINGKSHCEYCKAVYTSIDDFIVRNPRRGKGKEITFVDEFCWTAYEASLDL